MFKLSYHKIVSANQSWNGTNFFSDITQVYIISHSVNIVRVPVFEVFFKTILVYITYHAGTFIPRSNYPSMKMVFGWS